ncbi:hypothetical protein RW1_055_00590 [Rhodococcus wratislaviensis NBRC 100605]|uniref:Uncharacterized protein n=1 Tax=Rhodococcus wratislaviensis NBRC 100605 TaxID=1219028 RepID=X0PYJ8_RHOWR|nr:hypothetical protein RW1_055_00590 [Rhodococcus wratislaviensis NBRC 100605]
MRPQPDGARPKTHIAHSPPAATGTQRRSTRPRPHTHTRRNAATTDAPLRQPAKRHLAATCNILNPHTRNAPPASELEQAFAFRPQRHCNATACATVSVHAREIRNLTATGAARPRATTNPEPERTIRT